MNRISFLNAKVGVKFLLLVMTIFGLAGEGEARRVRMGLPSPGVSAVAFYVAQDKGYYQEEGLEVQLIYMRGPMNNVALIAGELNFTAVPTAGLAAALRGAPLQILYTTFHRPLFALMVKPDIRDVKGLKGRKVGFTRPGSATDVLLRELLKAHGLRAGRDVPLISGGNSPARLAAMMSGSIDATVLSVPWNIRAARAGFRELTSFFMQGDLALFLGTIVVHRNTLESDPTLVEKFLRGTLKGFLHARANRPDVVSILSRNVKVEESLSKEMFDLVRPAMTIDGTATKKIQRKYFGLVLKARGIKKAPPMERFFDFSLAKKVYGELKAEGWKPRP